jgi:hypothetical protein
VYKAESSCKVGMPGFPVGCLLELVVRARLRLKPTLATLRIITKKTAANCSALLLSPICYIIIGRRRRLWLHHGFSVTTLSLASVTITLSSPGTREVLQFMYSLEEPLLCSEESYLQSSTRPHFIWVRFSVRNSLLCCCLS